jgi:hypothetical protein
VFGSFNKLNRINPKDKDLIRLLEKLRDHLEVSKGIWSEYLGLNAREYGKVLEHKEPLSAVSLYHVSERLGLNPSVFETGRIDYVALLEAHRGNRHYINPAYLVAASSRKFTVVNAMNFIEKYRGGYLRIAASRHLQIDEDYWSDWEKPDSEQVNIRLIGDLWSFLRSRGLQDEDFRALGAHSITTYRSTHLGKSLSSFHHPRDLYEYLFGDFVKNIEQNHLYRITRLDSRICVIESWTNPDVSQALGVRNVGSLDICQVRSGIMESMPTFLDLPAAVVHETHCIHRGDPVCRFTCDFSRASAPERRGYLALAQ